MLVRIAEPRHDGHPPGVVTRAPSGMRTSSIGPTSTIRSPSIRTVWSCRGGERRWRRAEQTAYNRNRSLRHVGRTLRPLSQLLDRYLIENRRRGRLERLPHVRHSHTDDDD